MSSNDAAPLPRLGEVFFDVRGNSRSMRLSWYGDTGVAVFSIWQGGRCTGTFRLPVDELPRMMETLRTGPDAGASPVGHDISGAHGGPHRGRGRDDADGFPPGRPARAVDDAATSFLMEPPPDGYADRGASYPADVRRGGEVLAPAPGQAHSALPAPPGPGYPQPGSRPDPLSDLGVAGPGRPGYPQPDSRPDPLSDPLDQLADPLGLGYRGAEAGGYRGAAPYPEDSRTDPGDSHGYRGDGRYRDGPGYPPAGRDYPAGDSRPYGDAGARPYRAQEGRPYGAPDAGAYRTGDGQAYAPADGPGYPPADGRDYAAAQPREYPNYAAPDGPGFAPDERNQYPAGDGYQGGDGYATPDVPGYQSGGHSYPPDGYHGGGDYLDDDDPRYGPVHHGSRRERRLAAYGHGSAAFYAARAGSGPRPRQLA